MVLAACTVKIDPEWRLCQGKAAKTIENRTCSVCSYSSQPPVEVTIQKKAFSLSTIVRAGAVGREWYTPSSLFMHDGLHQYNAELLALGSDGDPFVRSRRIDFLKLRGQAASAVQYALFSANEVPSTSLFANNCTRCNFERLRAERLMRVLRLIVIVAAWLSSACLNAWAMAALYFDFSRAGREWLPATLYLVVLTVVLLTIPKSQFFRIGICFTGFFIVLVCWLSLKPSNDHVWQSNLSRTPWAEISGDRVTIHNFRHCYYRKETEFTCEWLTKEVFLSQVRGVDFFVDYWGSPWIAHPIISFQLGDNDYVAASIEARYQIGQGYSPIRSFFRQFTVIYVLASERDLIRLRTNYRSGEKVYLFHTTASPEWSRDLFVQYLRQSNRLRDNPAWFNAITNNCTTSIFANMAATGHMPTGSSRYSWWVLLNGRAPEMLYRGGNFTGKLPFYDLKEQAYINPAANMLNDSPDFSQRIRENRAGFESLRTGDIASPSAEQY